MAFILAELNGLIIVAGDVGNAYLNARSKENCFIQAGPEFGPDLEGLWLLIIKTLYGLKSSAARFHEHLSVALRKLGFRPSKADPDFWIRDKGDHYDYIARYVDDVIVFSKDPMAVMTELKKTYTMKDVGKPQYYLGGDIVTLDEAWEKEGIHLTFSAQTYIHNNLPKLAKMCGLGDFKLWNTPFCENYHAEMDKTPLAPPVQITIYQGLLGSANWIITLGRFDIYYAINTLSRYSMAPREGHMKAMTRVFGYLKYRPKGKILIGIGQPKVREDIGAPKDYD